MPPPIDARVIDAATPDAGLADARPVDARTIDAQIEQPLVGGYLEGGGCDCRTGSSGRPDGLWLLLGLGIWLRLRRKRR